MSPGVLAYLDIIQNTLSDASDDESGDEDDFCEEIEVGLEDDDADSFNPPKTIKEAEILALHPRILINSCSVEGCQLKTRSST